MRQSSVPPSASRSGLVAVGSSEPVGVDKAGAIGADGNRSDRPGLAPGTGAVSGIGSPLELLLLPGGRTGLRA